MKKRHKDIIQALKELGGEATIREIAEKTGLHVNGVSQSMNSVSKYVILVFLGGKGGEQRYRIDES